MIHHKDLSSAPQQRLAVALAPVNLSGVVRDQLRKEDVFVRYGGEEFCLLLPDVPGPGAVALAGRIRKAVARSSFKTDGGGLELTVSAGVAARIEEGPEALEALIARADEALYHRQEPRPQPRRRRLRSAVPAPPEPAPRLLHGSAPE